MDIKQEEIYAMAHLYQFGFCKEAEIYFGDKRGK